MSHEQAIDDVQLARQALASLVSDAGHDRALAARLSLAILEAQQHAGHGDSDAVQIHVNSVDVGEILQRVRAEVRAVMHNIPRRV